MKIIHYTFFCLSIVCLNLSYFLNYTPLLVPLTFLFMSVVSFLLYGKDKRAARKSAWRVPENTLHLFSLLGGWPGAIMAQQVLRHKTRKVSFQAGFCFVTLVNIGLLAWLHTSDGYATLHTFITALESFISSEFGGNIISNGFLNLLQYRSVF